MHELHGGGEEKRMMVQPRDIRSYQGQFTSFCSDKLKDFPFSYMLTSHNYLKPLLASSVLDFHTGSLIFFTGILVFR